MNVLTKVKIGCNLFCKALAEEMIFSIGCDVLEK